MLDVNFDGITSPTEDDVIMRQSTYNSWLLCPGRVMHSQDEGFNRVPSEPMLFGTLVHAKIEAYLLGDSPPVGSLLTEVEANDGFTLAEHADDATIEYMFDGVQMAFDDWLSQVYMRDLADYEPRYVERKIVKPLARTDDGRVIWVQGTPDLALDHMLVDWKTANRGWKENGDGLTKGSFNVQAPTYLWLDGLVTDMFRFYVYDRQKGVWESHTTRWTEKQIEMALRNIAGVGRAIAAGVTYYTPTQDTFGKVSRGWHCTPRYCGAWDICPGKDSVADNVDLEVEIDATWG